MQVIIRTGWNLSCIYNVLREICGIEEGRKGGGGGEGMGGQGKCLLVHRQHYCFVFVNVENFIIKKKRLSELKRTELERTSRS